ncbi:MAG: ABC transporter transmembrane domain-containing protein [Eubacterium sp.]
MSFSNAELDKFSTASLITRSTNDVQQIQMVSVILLRMVLYAPILAIGGIINVVNYSSGMEWTIVLAVAVVVCIIGVLMVVAMPKFNMMQKLVDKVNLISREILTGLSVIRAFSRERKRRRKI